LKIEFNSWKKKAENFDEREDWKVSQREQHHYFFKWIKNNASMSAKYAVELIFHQFLEGFERGELLL
jgi:hypothetical protein